MLLNSIPSTRSMIVSERLIRAQHHQFTRAVHQSHDSFAPSKRGIFLTPCLEGWACIVPAGTRGFAKLSHATRFNRLEPR